MLVPAIPRDDRQVTFGRRAVGDGRHDRHLDQPRRHSARWSRRQVPVETLDGRNGCSFASRRRAITPIPTRCTRTCPGIIKTSANQLRRSSKSPARIENFHHSRLAGSRRPGTKPFRRKRARSMAIDSAMTDPAIRRGGVSRRRRCPISTTCYHARALSAAQCRPTPRTPCRNAICAPSATSTLFAAGRSSRGCSRSCAMSAAPNMPGAPLAADPIEIDADAERRAPLWSDEPETPEAETLRRSTLRRCSA